MISSYLRIVIVIFVVVVLGGCTTYHQLKPLHPTVSNIKVNTLTPEIRWEPIQEEGITYDVIIYEILKQRRKEVAGETVYYRENISGSSHVVEEPLEWNKTYLWSVRARTGTEVREWSRYDFSAYFVFAYVQVRNKLFKLQPITKEKEEKMRINKLTG
ncbi:MAG: fibronectin type III domain-containing protein [Gammaproteobacteria bacterium]|nr:fibronectin type III domain-containing protein [Gammaproteobacteria bacterium]